MGTNFPPNVGTTQSIAKLGLEALHKFMDKLNPDLCNISNRSIPKLWNDCTDLPKSRLQSQTQLFFVNLGSFFARTMQDFLLCKEIARENIKM